MPRTNSRRRLIRRLCWSEQIAPQEDEASCRTVNDSRTMALPSCWNRISLKLSKHIILKLYFILFKELNKHLFYFLFDFLNKQVSLPHSVVLQITSEYSCSLFFKNYNKLLKPISISCLLVNLGIMSVRKESIFTFLYLKVYFIILSIADKKLIVVNVLQLLLWIGT